MKRPPSVSLPLTCGFHVSIKYCTTTSNHLSSFFFTINFLKRTQNKPPPAPSHPKSLFTVGPTHFPNVSRRVGNLNNIFPHCEKKVMPESKVFQFELWQALYVTTLPTSPHPVFLNLGRPPPLWQGDKHISMSSQQRREVEEKVEGKQERKKSEREAFLACDLSLYDRNRSWQHFSSKLAQFLKSVQTIPTLDEL